MIRFLTWLGLFMNILAYAVGYATGELVPPFGWSKWVWVVLYLVLSWELTAVFLELGRAEERARRIANLMLVPPKKSGQRAPRHLGSGSSGEYGYR